MNAVAPASGESSSTKAVGWRRSLYRPELDILRFIAFFGVFAFHTIDYPVQFFLNHHIPRTLAHLANAAISSGKYGVDLFFALSSYLITDLLVREKEQFGWLDVRSFYLRRVLRIWPLYYFVILLTLAVPFFDPQNEFGMRYLIPFILLSGNWSFAVYGGPAVPVSPMWSVSIEEQFYLLWPPVVARLSRQQIARAAWGMIILANVARLFLLLSHANAMALWTNTLAHLDSIAVGILLAVMLRGRAPIGRKTRIVLLAAAAICMAWRGHYQTVTGDWISWGAILFAWPAVAVASAMTLLAFIGLKLNLHWLQYLGKISYGLYAYHMFCIMTVDRILAGRVREHTLVHAALRESLALGLTIGAAAVSYAVLEKPFLKLKERFTRIDSRPL